MEDLWREADNFLSGQGSQHQRPDFSIPSSIPHHLTEGSPAHPYLELREEDEMKGKGWFAKADIPAGTIVMVSKPLAHVMDGAEEDETNEGHPEPLADDFDEEGLEAMDEDDERDPRLNEILLVQLLEKLVEDPTIWDGKQLSQLYPRNESEIDVLPPYVCSNDDIFLRTEALLKQLEQKTQLPVSEIKTRLPLVLRYNVLSMETCPELLSYPSSTFARLAGVGLFVCPSFFNHSSQPNISRWSIGDVLFICANQDITKGSECCLSYIEHDSLCEPAWRRNALLHLSRMDFADPETDDTNEEDESPEYPVVDDDVQNELMSMDPLERLSSIEELLQQARGEHIPGEDEEENIEEESMMVEKPQKWFHCDVQNLRILQAITLDGLGKTQEALLLWQDSLAFVRDHLPPNDEALIPVAVQAALCAYHGGDIEIARGHAAEALATHNLIFGNLGVKWFRSRLNGDLHLPLRPSQQTDSVIDNLWPLCA